MRSIFLKIFLWFWVAIALVASIFFTLGFHSRNIEINPNRQDFAYLTLNYYSQTALNLRNREGEAAFISFLKDLEAHIQVKPYIFDNQGQQIYGPPLPNQAKELLNTSLRDGMEIRREGRNYITQHRADNSGNKFNLIWEIKFGPPPFTNTTATHQVVRIIVVVIVTILLCYLLSSYLTSPIVHLTRVTQQLANGDLTARVGNNRVTRRKDELANLARNFDRMAERISYLLEAQKRLIRDISHELRSPLARLNVALVLARKRAGEPARSHLDRIELESERLNELIEQLLTLARLENGKDNIQFDRINLEYLVQELAADADFEAQGTGKTVTVTNAEPCEIKGNEMLLRRAIENVLRNAIHYTAERSSVEISLTCATILEKLYAVISVRDHGSGVPEDTLAELFRPFYRVGDARERESGGSGTGLGLAIVEQAVKLHNGQVKAANTSEGGLKIDIQIPVF